MGAIEQLLTNIDESLIGFVNSIFIQLSPAVHNLWRVLMIMFVVIYGYRVMVSGNFEAREMFVKTLKMVIVLAVATEWAPFSIFVYDLSTQFPSEIADQMLAADNKNSDNINSSITAFFDEGFRVAGKFFDEAGWTNKMYPIYGFLVCVFTILFGAYAAFLIILAKLAVALLLALAPIFILLLVFNESRELFMGWLRTLINYALIPLFVYALLGLIGAIISDRLIDLNTAFNTKKGITEAMAGFALCTFAGFLLSTQIMSIVGGITGGYTLGTLGTVSRNAFRTARFGSAVAKRTPATARKGTFVAGGAISEGASALGRTLRKNRTGGGA